MKSNYIFNVFDLFCARIGVGRWSDNQADIWRENRRWEYSQLDEQSLWEKEKHQEELMDLREILESNPEEAFKQYIGIAELGSAWAMCMVAMCYLKGIGVQPDHEQLLKWYRRSSKCGNTRATLDLRNLLRRDGDFEEAEAVLVENAPDDWGPAVFSRAWTMLKRSETPQTLRWARPLLERAAQQGSPAAQWMLARQMASGRFEFSNIPEGWKSLWRFTRRMKPEWSGS